MGKNEVTFDKLLTKENFNRFIEDEKLVTSKTKISRYFSISTRTLYSWMRENGYSRFIGTFKGSKGKDKKGDRSE